MQYESLKESSGLEAVKEGVRRFFGIELQDQISVLKELLNTIDKDPHAVKSTSISMKEKRWQHEVTKVATAEQYVALSVFILQDEVRE